MPPVVRSFRAFALCALLALAVTPPATPALAAWPHDPCVNLLVCGAAQDQFYPVALEDGAGGAFIAWTDSRNFGATDVDLYLGHVTVAGVMDPAWPVNGLAVSTAAGVQTSPVLVSDGAGGVIVAWTDRRAVNSDIWAQRITRSGTVSPGWPAGGVQLTGTAQDDVAPRICTNGAGGAFVAYQWNLSPSDHDPRLVQVLANGTIPPAFGASGINVDPALTLQEAPVVAPDGAGGVFVAYQTDASGSGDIRVARLAGSGTVLWNRVESDPSYAENGPVIVADGTGAVTVAWSTFYGVSYWYMFGVRVLANGDQDPYWGGPVTISPGGDSYYAEALVDDGKGGAYWIQRVGYFGSNLYSLSHVSNSGGQWATTPPIVGLGAVVGVPDGTGGVLVGNDAGILFGGQTVAYHRLLSAANAPGWPDNGIVACQTEGSTGHSGVGACSDGRGGILVFWSATRSGAADILGQRIERFGRLGDPEPAIVGVRDVLNDQGGQVRVSWSASYLDVYPNSDVSRYTLWRQIPAAAARSALASGRAVLAADGMAPAEAHRVLTTTVAGTQTYYWEAVGSQDAAWLAGYSMLAPTTGDSGATANPRTAFMVTASAAPALWYSAPDSGYSVDNLAPAMPAPFTGSYTSSGTFLGWGANLEPDLGGYRLYRGTTTEFVPSPANRIASLTQTNFHDLTTGAIYKLSAVDVHGNESPFAVLTPSGSVDAPAPALPRELALRAPAPNPAREATAIGFALPRATTLTLEVFDAGGRRVRLLAAGARPAGEHVATWDGCDASGARVGAGLYFARLRAEGRTFTRRLVRVE